ncbi:hypothetical protein H0H92_003284 [Tricholoma furcatifolium]|nr:hypothetical protein H0H92_003284 [Tricholoma furcatifolium]
MTHRIITIEPGWKGNVSAVADSRAKQRATVTIVDSADSRILASTTFVGKGSNVPLSQETNPNSFFLTFGPFDKAATVNVVIEHSELESNDDKFIPSEVIIPAVQEAAAASPASYLTTTVFSEDSYDDLDYTDCVISVVQYQ